MPLSNYTIGKQLGKGVWGVVHEGTDKRTGDRVAIKVADPSMFTRHTQFIRREFLIGQTAAKACKFALRYIETFDDIIPIKLAVDLLWRNRKTVFIVMEYLPGYSIRQYIECCRDTKWYPDEKEIIKFMIWMYEIVGCLHTAGIAHGDLNTGNIYYDITARHLFAIDFGGACDVTKSQWDLWPGEIDLTCNLGKIVTAPFYKLPAISRQQLNIVPLPINRLSHLFKLNDLYTIMVIGILLVDPNTIPRLSANLKAANEWKKMGLTVAVANASVDTYEAATGIKILKLRKFFTDASTTFDKGGSDVTAGLFVKMLQ